MTIAISPEPLGVPLADAEAELEEPAALVRAKRPVLAQIARQYADLSIVTNEDPFGESPEAIIDEILAGAPKEERGRIFVREPDRDAAIRRAVREAGPGDAVVILGKGHEQSIVVNGYKEPWSDSAAVRAAIEALA